MQMLKAEHNKSLRQIDEKFEELVRSIPAHILAMTMGEVKKLKDFNEVLIEEKMSNLNMTVMETVQKVDEGKHKLFSSLAHLVLISSFLLSFLTLAWL